MIDNARPRHPQELREATGQIRFVLPGEVVEAEPRGRQGGGPSRYLANGPGVSRGGVKVSGNTISIQGTLPPALRSRPAARPPEGLTALATAISGCGLV